MFLFCLSRTGTLSQATIYDKPSRKKGKWVVAVHVVRAGGLGLHRPPPAIPRALQVPVLQPYATYPQTKKDLPWTQLCLICWDEPRACGLVLCSREVWLTLLPDNLSEIHANLRAHVASPGALLEPPDLLERLRKLRLTPRQLRPQEAIRRQGMGPTMQPH